MTTEMRNTTEGRLGLERALRRGRIGSLLLVLLISASAFAFLIVWTRDKSVRRNALRQADAVCRVLQAHLDERGYLPATLPVDGPGFDGNPLIAYPPRELMPQIRGESGPYVLVTGPKQGMIMPGDGCAAVVFEDGQLEVTWLGLQQVPTERARREEMLAD